MERSTQRWDDLESTEQGSSSSAPSDVVGFESYEAELEGWLLDNEFKHKVIFLVGMGGVGKTTLAELVYNKTDIKAHFSCLAWLTVSPSFDQQKLIASMARQFHKAISITAEDSAPFRLGEELIHDDNKDHEQLMHDKLLEYLEEERYDDNKDHEQLMHDKLLEYLEEKRYVVVFDDVWDVSFCEHIRNILPETRRGCTIVITTRVYKNLDVGWPQSFFVRFLELQPLDPTMAWKLFSKTLSQNIVSPALEKLSHVIVERCGGLPAALVVVGRFFSAEKRNFLGWQRFLEEFPTEIQLNSSLKDMTRSLLPRLGYLPLDLESCFLYFGIYPKDYLVSRARLIRQWLAEGFVESEDKGDDYLNELVSLSLVQVSNTNYTIDGKPRWCRVHNLMHDVIQSVCTRKPGIFLYRPEESEYDEDSFIESHLRPRFPYMVGDRIRPFDSSKWYANDRYKLLKMLDLEGCRDLICVPEEVGSLIFLKYLSVRNTTIMILPKSIGQLQKLETLDLKYSLVCELPLEINALRELRYILAYYYGKRTYHHLNAVQGLKINEGFGHSESLRKLYHIEANNDVGLMKELRNFSELRKLGITKLTKETSRALCTSFETMYQLENLQLFSANSDEILDLQTLSFSSPLRSLRLEGCLEKLPDCVQRLQTLVSLTLSFSKLTDDPLEAIQYLVSLIKLELYEAYDGEQLCFKHGGFQNLKMLTMRGLPRLKSMVIEEWTLPYLEEFTIGQSPKLEEVPPGIRHLRTLKSLKFFDMADDFGLSMVPEGGQHYSIVQHIPDVRFYYKRDGGKRYDVYPLR